MTVFAVLSDVYMIVTYVSAGWQGCTCTGAELYIWGGAGHGFGQVGRGCAVSKVTSPSRTIDDTHRK
eukprot:1146547-Pyramimonas_sp.AAC.1